MSSLTAVAALFVFSLVAVISVAGGLGDLNTRKTVMLTAHILLGSVAAGILYLLIIRLQPPRTAWNLGWFIGIPLLLAILRRPRVPNIALAVPLLFGGWMSYALIAWTFRIAVD